MATAFDGHNKHTRHSDLITNGIEDGEDFDTGSSLDDIIEQLLTIGCTEEQPFANATLFEEKYRTSSAQIPKEYGNRPSVFDKYIKSTDICYYNSSHDQKLKNIDNDEFGCTGDSVTQGQEKQIFNYNFTRISEKKVVTLKPIFRNCFTSRHDNYRVVSRSEQNGPYSGTPLLDSGEESGEDSDISISDISDDVINRNGDAKRDYNSRIVEESTHRAVKYGKMSLLDIALTGTQRLQKHGAKQREPRYVICEQDKLTNGNDLKDDKWPVIKRAKVGVKIKSGGGYFTQDKKNDSYSTHATGLQHQKGALSKQRITIEMTASGAVPEEADIDDYLSCEPFKLRTLYL